MIKEVVTYPDKRLKMRSSEVEKFDDELHKLLNDMHDTMVDKNGVGLASIQIGIPKRVFIVHIPIYDEDDQNSEQNKRDKNDNEKKQNVYLPEDLIEVINPEIIALNGKTKYEEGCLSVPQYYDTVERAETIEIKYKNRFGETVQKVYDGIIAIAFQHEIDHLDGKLFVEKLSYLRRKKFEREIVNTNKKAERS